MTKPAQDGNLPAALHELKHAIQALTSEQGTYLDGQYRSAPSLYMQLRDALTGEQGTGYNGAPQSQPPIWIDAMMLLEEIDTAAEIWHPQLQGIPVTVGRLNALTTQQWRPQDVHGINQIIAACKQWAAKITAILNPGSVKHFRAPDGDGYAACPQCGQKTTYRVDPTDGESKKVPTLQWIASTGTTCIVCHASWEPERTLWLGRVLGFELPAGVLE